MAEIRLPETLYETLHFASLAFGGIGAGQDFYYDYDGGYGCPLCIHGLARLLDDTARRVWRSGVVSDALELYGIWRSDNDAAVKRINDRKFAACDARVTWEEWCAELNVVCVPDEADARRLSTRTSWENKKQ